MILTLQAPSGSTIKFDFRDQLGSSVELDCFRFVEPPVEFRLTRNGVPLQEWQAGNTDMYDLQHGPLVREWCRDDHWFQNDLAHRDDVATCGVLSRDLVMETHGLGIRCLVHVWPREGTWREIAVRPSESLTQLETH